MSAALPVEAVVARIKAVYGGWTRSTPVKERRRDWDALFASVSVAAAIEPVSAGGVAAEWIIPRGARPDQAVLYLHGGGFQVGSLRSHRELMAGIAEAAGCRVLGVDYRLAPEHRYPAALHDARAAYAWLLGQGFQSPQLALAGDSAGAGLALSTLISLRDEGRPLPAAAVLMSAWTDLTASGASYQSRAHADPINQRPMILAMARSYLGDAAEPRDPLVSPLFAALRGLPPLLIQVGDHETVLSDSTDLAEKATAAGITVDLEVWEGMIHVFQQFPAELIEAREARQSIGTFLRRHLREEPLKEQSAATGASR